MLDILFLINVCLSLLMLVLAILSDLYCDLLEKAIVMMLFLSTMDLATTVTN